MTGSGKERSDVFPLASIVVAAHINDLLAESAAERLARSAKPSSKRHNRITSAVTSVWSNLSGAAGGPVTAPKLTDYPFKS
jgi:hypothetical protein